MKNYISAKHILKAPPEKASILINKILKNKNGYSGIKVKKKIYGGYIKK